MSSGTKCLQKVAWRFTTKPFTDAAAFNTAVTSYQKDIFSHAKDWLPDSIAVDAASVRIQYECWVKTKDSILPNESLADGFANALDAPPNPEYGGYHEVEMVALFTADNERNFTALELLYKAHNQLANKYLGDHVFFEGFTAESNDSEGVEGGAPPRYFIHCGS